MHLRMKTDSLLPNSFRRPPGRSMSGILSLPDTFCKCRPDERGTAHKKGATVSVAGGKTQVATETKSAPKITSSGLWGNIPGFG